VQLADPLGGVAQFDGNVVVTIGFGAISSPEPRRDLLAGDDRGALGSAASQ
jgi:hypothetical protein